VLILSSHALEFSSVWEFPTVRAIVADGRHKDLFPITSTAHYLDNLERIGQETFLPEIDDILKFSKPTNGVFKHTGLQI
jgi:hypothetical protein